MKKTLTAALAIAMLTGTAGVASAQSVRANHGVQISIGTSAQAQHHNDRYDRRDDRRDNRWERREDRRDDRYERRRDRQERAEQRRYERWQRAQRRYSAGRYYAPRGYQARTWGYGQRMPYQYRTNQYVVRDYSRYGLYAPPQGYQYVRSGNDVVLTAVTTGLVVAVIASLFQ